MDYIKRSDATSDKLCEGISCNDCPFNLKDLAVCRIDIYLSTLPAADVISREDAIHSLLKHCENTLSGANVSYETTDIYRIAYQHAIDDIKRLL